MLTVQPSRSNYTSEANTLFWKTENKPTSMPSTKAKQNFQKPIGRNEFFSNNSYICKYIHKHI